MTVNEMYQRLRAAGLSHAGAVGLLGNIKAESGFISYNLQQTYEKKLGMSDKEYTSAVDSGKYSKEKFTKDAAGYGLAQWTYKTRKANLYDFAKKKKASIGSADMQIEFLIEELKNSYKAVYNKLCKTDSIDEAARYVMLKFEKPANVSETAQKGRVKLALQVEPLCDPDFAPAFPEKPAEPEKPKEEKPKDKPKETKKLSKYKVIALAGVNIREKQDVNSKKVGAFNNGQIVEGEAVGSWLKTAKGYSVLKYFKKL